MLFETILKELVMILGLQIGMLIYGIMALISGKLTLSKTRVVTGPMARYLAIVLLAPVPVAYLAHGSLHANFLARGKMAGNENGFRWTMIGVEAAITLLCFGVVFGVGWASAGDPTKRREDEDDRAERYGRDRWDVVPREPRNLSVEPSPVEHASTQARTADSVCTADSIRTAAPITTEPVGAAATGVAALPTAILVGPTREVHAARRPRAASRASDSGPVCGACGAEIDLGPDRRLPPWCVHCGKNL
jgi:hypothetical protein